MKKIIIFLILAVVAVQTLPAKSVKSLMNEFRHEKNAEYAHVSPLLMMLARIVATDKDMGDSDRMILKKIKSIRTLSLEDCTKEVKEKFVSETQKLDDEYEPLLMANTDDEQARIMMKTKGKTIRELIMLSIDGDDCTIAWFKGKLSNDDIQKIFGMNNKKSKAKRKKSQPQAE